MKRITFTIAVLFVTIGLFAQDAAPVLGTLTNGSGIYSGLKKIPKTCTNGPGNFYVSSANDNAGNGIKWLTTTSTSTNIKNSQNGLANTKALLWSTYSGINIDANGLASTLSSYPSGMSGTPAGAIEVCFQKNYSNGNLISGTTPANMWYLPSKDELALISRYATINNSAFVGAFTSEYYWSSTENTSSEAWNIKFSSSYIDAKAKSNLNRVRCIRNSVTERQTIAVTNITATSATSGGSITYDVSATITSRGVCWNTNQNPTITNTKTVNGTGDGQFTSSLTGLTPNTTYYVRAYFTTSSGTTYGSQVIFRTKGECGAFVSPGVWKYFMCHNLGADVTSAYGTPTSQINGNYYQFGKLNSVATGATSATAISGWSTTASMQGAWSESSKTVNDPCPSGYCVPSKATWTGVVANNTRTNVPSTWGAANATQYANGAKFGTSLVLPAAGSRLSADGALSNRGGAGYYWSSTDAGNGALTFTNTTASTQFSPISTSGFSVRCVEDNLPKISTSSATNVNTASFTIGGFIDSDGGSPVIARGVCWSIIPNPTVANSTTSSGTGIGFYTGTVSGLLANATYYVRAYAITSAGVAYGQQVTVTTIGIMPPDGGVIIDNPSTL